jgi:hypothetical protein
LNASVAVFWRDGEQGRGQRKKETDEQGPVRHGGRDGGEDSARVRAVQVRALAEGDGLDVAEAGERLRERLGVDGGVAVDGEVELERLEARAVRE